MEIKLEEQRNENEGKLFLASHYDSNMSARPEQNRLKDLFAQKYYNRFCYIPAGHVP